MKSISFEKGEVGDDGLDPGISSVGVEDDFKCPNFLVSTGSALVVLVESKLFYELSPENRRGGNRCKDFFNKSLNKMVMFHCVSAFLTNRLAGRLVLQGLDSPVHGLCCHPQLPLVAVCGYSGFLHMWSLGIDKKTNMVHVFIFFAGPKRKMGPNSTSYQSWFLLIFFFKKSEELQHPIFAFGEDLWEIGATHLAVLARWQATGRRIHERPLQVVEVHGSLRGGGSLPVSTWRDVLEASQIWMQQDGKTMNNINLDI